MATTQTTSTTELHWNAGGQTACAAHIIVGGSLYKLEGWEPIPADLLAEAEELGVRCERCPAA